MKGLIQPKRILMIFAAILGLYTIAGFFLVPWMGKKTIIKQLGNALERPVAITCVSMNPYSLILGIKGFSIKEKKELNLEIEGSYDRIQDGEALRKKGYEALIKSEKIKEMTVKGRPAPSLEDVTLLPEERELAVLAAYEQAGFPKPMEE